jgi:CheY-like chemotaxis protein
VLTAASGSEAVQLFGSLETPLAAAIVDMNMPGLNGLETMRALRRGADSLPVILTSGYTNEVLTTGLPAGTRFIQKPYSNAELVELVRDVIRAEAAPTLAA